MSWTSGFFNSVGGDRTYNADQINNIFEGLITNGVYNKVGNQMAVQANNGMTIQINTGRGVFGGHWVKNEAVHLLTLEESDVTLNRYCAVCVRVNENTEARNAEPYLKYSEFASAPIKPTMERTEAIKEYCLAYVYIGAGVSEITASNIEDTRANTSLCGWVTGLIEQVDTTTLWEQFASEWSEWKNEQTTEFVEWFNGLQEYLTENAEAKLAADVLALQNRVTKVTGTFDGLGWVSHEDGTYTQAITVNGVTATNDIFVTPSVTYREAYKDMCCEAIAQAQNTITFKCINPQDIPMTVEVVILTI